MDFMPDRAPVIRNGRTDAGTLTTRPITFTGEHLFVNADVSRGELRVEVLDESGTVIAPFTRDACVPITANGTQAAHHVEQRAVARRGGEAARSACVSR